MFEMNYDLFEFFGNESTVMCYFVLNYY